MTVQSADELLFRHREDLRNCPHREGYRVSECEECLEDMIRAHEAVLLEEAARRACGCMYCPNEIRAFAAERAAGKKGGE